ncbi:MAG: hypothetical protein MZU84_02670 [Sphingobacterium sp.]|nr:hypothetical protein [Sphingobacterium sp.]
MNPSDRLAQAVVIPASILVGFHLNLQWEALKSAVSPGMSGTASIPRTNDRRWLPWMPCA